MSPEIRRLNRRDFLKITTASLLLTAAGKEFQKTSSFSGEVQTRTEAAPRLKEIIQPKSISLGIYPHNNDLASVSRPDIFNITGLFQPWHDWTAGMDNRIFLDGQVPMLSINPYFENARNRPFRYKDLVDQKEHIRKQAKQLESIPPCLFRFGYEMNGNWFPHGTSAQTSREFIDGWKLVSEIVKETNPTLKTVWSPNVGYPIEKYYPEDSGSELEPDIVGLDGYNKHHLSSYHIRSILPNPSFEKLFGKDVSMLQGLTDKPIYITEVGIDYGDAPQACKEAFDWMVNGIDKATSWQGVEGICLFAWNKGRGIFDANEGNWGDILSHNLYENLENNPYMKR
jgi:hypothetical protein